MDSRGNPRQRRSNLGHYLVAESNIFREQDPEQGLGVYGPVGVANPKLNQFGMFAGGGLMYAGPRSWRADQVGLGVATAVNGGNYKDATPGAKSAETNFELSYRMQVFPWLAVQPDLQFVLKSGTDPPVDNAAVFACRFETSF